jgi:hypothetical protein
MNISQTIVQEIGAKIVKWDCLKKFLHIKKVIIDRQPTEWEKNLHHLFKR